MDSSSLASVVLFTAVCLGPVACHAPSRSDVRSSDGKNAPAHWAYSPDLPVSRAPFSEVHANFKERLEQPYVFVEVRGSYTMTGRQLVTLASSMRAAGVEASGPPFALYFDDPGRVSVDALRSRACIPVERAPEASSKLAYDVLPRDNVVYAVVGGPYPEVPRAYPGLYRYMERMGWVEHGPVREIYLVPPASVKSFDDLLCEVQIPAAPRP